MLAGGLSACSQLSTENVVVEKEFVEQLKALEHESAEAERKLRAVLQAKAKVGRAATAPPTHPSRQEAGRAG